LGRGSFEAVGNDCFLHLGLVSASTSAPPISAGTLCQNSSSSLSQSPTPLVTSRHITSRSDSSGYSSAHNSTNLARTNASHRFCSLSIVDTMTFSPMVDKWDSWYCLRIDSSLV
jgi:hypothetical protein